MRPEPLDATIKRRMQRQRRRDTGVELAIRRRLHADGYRFRVDFRLDPTLRCRGDIVFTKRRVVVFVDGCFWHGCPQHSTAPVNNAAWWQAKLAANVERDQRNTRALAESGWTVIRIWEHVAIEDALDRIRRAVDGDDEPDRRRA